LFLKEQVCVLRTRESSPPKKNLILSAERLRRVWRFASRMRRAAAPATGGAAGSRYFKYSAPFSETDREPLGQ